MSKISFGEPLGFLDQGYDFNCMIQAQREQFRYISVTNNFPLLDVWTKRNPFLKLFKQKPSMFFTFARRIVRERLAKAEKEQKTSGPYEDLLESFIAARKAYPLMDETRLTHISATNVLAGANNSARAIDVTFHWLANHPEEQERLYDEIMSVKAEDLNIDTEGPAALEMAMKMPYLHAMIQESYRLFGAASNNLERVVSEAGMTLPDGTYLPPGTVATMNPPAMAALPNVYGQDALQFRPSRWLRQDGESEQKFQDRTALMKRSLIVFGHGSRVCIGKNIVQLELYKLWATLLRLYRVSVAARHCGQIY
jgi:cytochrome P450